ncbi:MAG: type 1 glutamine amidotransferase [Nocardioidaceae bacterium]
MQPLLVVEHEDQCPPGWLGEWLAEAGATLDVRRPYAGDALPGDLRGHHGLVVLGGEMGAHDDHEHPWLAGVKRLVVGAVHDGTPVLGICLGHQLVAVALGGVVAPNPLGQQIGVLDVGWTPAAGDDRLLGSLARRPAPAPAVQWNNDLVTRLPDGAVDLAHTGRGELQAARFAPAVWGVQWHPEAGEEIIGPWAEHDRDDAVERGVDVDAYVADVTAARADLRSTWRLLADAFAAVCAEPRPVRTLHP